ncbi:hypothetical protein [Sorangium sp. So ce1000]|uniref:hypothetical protein n=1 Tax=Sorangium sp. So ce1000 TaxID=3133325 RepID=UPI003F5F7B7C
MSMDSEQSSEDVDAPHDSGSVTLELAAMSLTEEQLASIQNEAVRSAIRSVTELRQGRRSCDSLTLSEWVDFASAPAPAPARRA